jgi:hypothetical protein
VSIREDDDAQETEAHQEQGHCHHCGVKLSAEKSRRLFCSTECYEDAGGPDWERKMRTCVACGKSYRPRVRNQQFCSPSCRRSDSQNEPMRKRPSRKCFHCGAEFLPGTDNQKYCGQKCSIAHQALEESKETTTHAACEFCGGRFPQKSPQDRFCSTDCQTRQQRKKTGPAICECCGRQFTPKSPEVRFCSPDCRGQQSHSCQICGCPLPRSTAHKTHLCDECRKDSTPSVAWKSYVSDLLPFTFRNKSEFQDWFNISFPLFGIKQLLRSDAKFPSVTCLTFSGDTLRIQLELVSPKFRQRNGAANEVDLVICAARRPEDRSIYGIPVFALTVSTISGDSVDYKHLTLSPEAEKMFRSNMRFMVEDDLE